MPLSNTRSFFVTGTDTDAGKTTVTRALILTLQNAGLSAIGCKPIACGINEYGHNADVQAYLDVNSLKLTSAAINPLTLMLPCSPNIAAQAAGTTISVKHLAQQLQPLSQLSVDAIFYEGIGGWKVPLNTRETTADLARNLQAALVLVVGLRVGCLNHALLTWDAIQQESLPIAGWIGNVIDPHIPALDAHLHTLQHWITCPYLGTLPYQAQDKRDFAPIFTDYPNILSLFSGKESQ